MVLRTVARGSHVDLGYDDMLSGTSPMFQVTVLLPSSGYNRNRASNKQEGVSFLLSLEMPVNFYRTARRYSSIMSIFMICVLH
jgi:hypothetical protein